MTTGREPIGRAIDVLVWLATNPAPAWRIRQVARELDASPATIHRIFGVFEGRGLLGRGLGGTYVPGLELYRVGQSVANRMSPVRIVHHILEALASSCGETVLLGAYGPARGEMMYLDMVQSPHPIRYVLECNQWIPIHAGATGLAIYGALSETERENIYERGLSQLTEATLVTEKELEEAVRRVQRDGYIWTCGQRQSGAVGIASPVFDAAGEVFGDVCVTIPEQRARAVDLEDMGGLVRKAAGVVTDEFSRIGYLRGWAVAEVPAAVAN